MDQVNHDRRNADFASPYLSAHVDVGSCGASTQIMLEKVASHDSMDQAIMTAEMQILPPLTLVRIMYIMLNDI